MDFKKILERIISIFAISKALASYTRQSHLHEEQAYQINWKLKSEKVFVF